MGYRIIHDKDIVRKHQFALGAKTWPEFMQHDQVVTTCWPELYSRFADFQFALFDDEEIVGIGNTIPVRWDETPEDLPDGGVDWALEKGNKEYLDGIKPNILVAMQILISENYKGRGISTKMVETMIEIARTHQFDYVALPVRPTLKSEFPQTPMEVYAYGKREDGSYFDPWVRVHMKLGGKIVGICHESMVMEGSVQDWEKWTGKTFPETGDYIVKGALSPVKIDLENNTGMYIEPNVWVIHSV